jgi:hypothetical protein
MASNSGSLFHRLNVRVWFGLALLILLLILIWVYYRDILLPAFVIALLVTIPLVLLWPLMKSVAVQQVTLFVLLIAGLTYYLIAGWRLLSTGAIDSAANVSELQKAGLQLFLPYLGIAIGGVFGVKRLSATATNAPADLHTFFVALAVVVLWDALAIGNLWAMPSALQTSAMGIGDTATAAAGLVSVDGSTEIWAFEDALRFINDVMPLLSFLPAAAIGFYFGAQSGTTGVEHGSTSEKQGP